ncbi:hypothetical protein [Streptomyces tateyamensis]|nr:hypothetical protein [Streptomyces tateyamensis]
MVISGSSAVNTVRAGSARSTTAVSHSCGVLPARPISSRWRSSGERAKSTRARQATPVDRVSACSPSPASGLVSVPRAASNGSVAAPSSARVRPARSETTSWAALTRTHSSMPAAAGSSEANLKPLPRDRATA